MNYYETGEINNLADLMLAAKNAITAGYECNLNIRGNFREAGKPNEISPFTIIDVEFTEPELYLDGEYWFWQDGKVMQVL